MCHLSFVIPNELKASSESRWSGLNRRPAHYECAALPLSYTGGLRNESYRAPGASRQADAVGGREGEDLGAPRGNHLRTSSRAGFEPHPVCGNIQKGLALIDCAK